MKLQSMTFEELQDRAAYLDRTKELHKRLTKINSGVEFPKAAYDRAFQELEIEIARRINTATQYQNLQF